MITWKLCLFCFVPPVATPIKRAYSHKFNNSYLFWLSRSLVTDHFVCKYEAVGQQSKSTLNLRFRVLIANYDILISRTRRQWRTRRAQSAANELIKSGNLTFIIHPYSNNELDTINLSIGRQAGLRDSFEMEGKPDPHRIYINNSNKPYLEFIYSASNNLINLRWSWEKIEIALGPDINATLNIPAC